MSLPRMLQTGLETALPLAQDKLLTCQLLCGVDVSLTLQILADGGPGQKDQLLSSGSGPVQISRFWIFFFIAIAKEYY